MRHANPEIPLAVQQAAEYAAHTTELGAVAWNAAIATGTLSLSRITVAPDQWHSMSSGAGKLVLGTAAMSPSLRDRLIFQGETLSREGEISRRLLHELGHGAIYRAQRSPAMRQLRALTHDVRVQDLRYGLSPLCTAPSSEHISINIRCITIMSS